MSKNIDDFEIFPWNHNFDTGIAIIDEQHRKLINLLNKLAGCLIQDDNIRYIDIFDELAAYARYHFETEEAIWESSFANDSWIKKHRESHSCFMPQVLEIKEQQIDKPVKEGLQNILKFLIRWLIYHIIESDKHMAIVVKQMEAGASFEEAKKVSQKKMLNSEQVLIDAILLMYDELSSRSLVLEHQRVKRQRVVRKLNQANRDLRKLATIDQLTGLYNRRHFNSTFEEELRRAKRKKHYLTFLMLDIDYFKILNDQYGHVQGDEALQKVGQKLTELCRRPGDFVFRMGGEEFGILISDQGLTQNDDFFEQIRTGIEDLKIENSGSSVSEYVTVSIGTVSKIPDLSDNIEDYMKLADARLYAAKKNGRNRVVSKG